MDGLDVAEVAGRMRRRDAVGLLHDGAGWDAARVAAELGTSARQVRIEVARARLDAAEADCNPCERHLDGLMSFAAQAIDHSLLCAECKATRQALRQGKQRLRDRWTDVGDPRQAAPPRPQPTDAPATTPSRIARPTTPTRSAHMRVDRHDGQARPRGRLTSGAAQTAPTPAPWSSTGAGGAPRPVSLPDRSPDQVRLAAVRRRSASGGDDVIRSSGEGVRPAAEVGPADRRGVRRAVEIVMAVAVALASRVPRRLVLVLLLASGAALVVAAMSTSPSERDDDGRSVLSSTGSDATPLPGIQLVVTESARTQAADPTPTPTPTPMPTPVPVATPVLEEPPFEVDVETWQELAMCESSGDWSANTGNGFYGGLQFLQESWELVGGRGVPHEASAFEQIMRAEMLLELQGWRAWPVCSRQLGLR